MPQFETTGGVLLVAFFFLLVASVVYLRLRGRSSAVPNVAVSLGITFTFVGISIALFGFDVDDIQASIPRLLDGMRLAFLTSICGMVVAVWYRLAPGMALWRSGASAEKEDGATVDTLAVYLRQIGEALVGDGEATVSTQLQKVRLAVVDTNGALVEEFRAFAATMAEQNTSALIEAVEGVMANFNAKINEQLGENFARFNEGLGQLLEWQDEYKGQVAELTDQFDRCLQGVEASERALTTIAERSAQFAEVADALEVTIKAYDTVVDELKGHLYVFAEVAKGAQDAFPVIRANVEDLTAGFAEAVRAATESAERAAQAQRDAVAQMSAAVRDEQTALSESVRRLTDETSESIATQFEVLDDELGRELQKALSSLGSQLTSLSAKFVSDYEPLTEKLRLLVREASRGDGGAGRPDYQP